MTIRLEEGKEYVTRSGERVGPVRLSEYVRNVFRDDNYFWFSDGKRNSVEDDSMDIVIEAAPKAPSVPTQRILKPGKYGIVHLINTNNHKEPRVDIFEAVYTPEQLREAAHILNQIAEFMESEQ